MEIAKLSEEGVLASVFVTRTETAKHTLGWGNVSTVITSFPSANGVKGAGMLCWND